MEDPELIEKWTAEDITSKQNPYSDGLYLLSLTNEQVEQFGLFINDFYKMLCEKDRDKHRQITRNAMTMMKGAIFAVGTSENNPEWKEHCSSSLREIFHEWRGDGAFTSDFCHFFRKGAQLKLEESEAFKRLRLYYEYFSGIDHHEAAGIMHSLRSISKDSSLKLEDCYSDSVFIERVKDFFSILAEVVGFSKLPKQDKDNESN